MSNQAVIEKIREEAQKLSAQYKEIRYQEATEMLSKYGLSEGCDIMFECPVGRKRKLKKCRLELVFHSNSPTYSFFGCFKVFASPYRLDGSPSKQHFMVEDSEVCKLKKVE